MSRDQLKKKIQAKLDGQKGVSPASPPQGSPAQGSPAQKDTPSPESSKTEQKSGC